MQKPPPHPYPESASRGTATSRRAFVETIEHNRFVEFCDACRHFRYVGLCYGPPGVGKTLSALRYSRADQIVPRDRWTSEVTDDRPVDTLLYTTSVVNTPSRVEIDIRLARERMMSIVLDPIRREAATVLEEIRLKDEKSRREVMNKPGCSPCDRPAVDPTYFETYKKYQAKQRAVSDPTTFNSCGRGRSPTHEQSRTNEIDLRRGNRRYGADRDAWHREARSPISAVLFAYWFCP